MNDNSVGSVKLSKIKNIIEAVEKHNHDDIDMDISAEFLIPSCFPEIWKNFQNNVAHQYTLGYIAGYEDGKNSKDERFQVDSEDNI